MAPYTLTFEEIGSKLPSAVDDPRLYPDRLTGRVQPVVSYTYFCRIICLTFTKSPVSSR
jgi:hypothetical protein